MRRQTRPNPRLHSRRLLLLGLTLALALLTTGCAESILGDLDAQSTGDTRDTAGDSQCVGPACADASNPDAGDTGLCMRNECGGCAVLSGRVDDSCGACGRWACDGMDALMCQEGQGNACGGCMQLSMIPDDPCGTCGVVVCDGMDNVVCNEMGAVNSCGGCDALPGVSGQSCGDCSMGTWTCVSDNSMTCEGDSQNACGGCQTLSAEPTSSCGACGGGTYQCNGMDAVECQGAGAMNACGGCGVLTGTINDPCGTCMSGTLGCNMAGDMLECQNETPCVDDCNPPGGMDNNDTYATATFLGSYDDGDNSFESLDSALHAPTDIDQFTVHVDDLAFYSLDIIAELDNLATDVDLCVFWERDDLGLTDVSCPDGVYATLGTIEGCCSENLGTLKETVTLVDDSGGAGIDDSGWVTYYVYTYESAAICRDYTLRYRF